MPSFWERMLLFADQAGQKFAPEQVAEQVEAPGPAVFVLPLVMTFVIFYFLILGPERRRQKKKQELIDSLKKNDRVLTIGGMWGVVANVKPGEDEIVIKIDEDKDVKVRITKSSIAQVMSTTEKTEGQ